MDMTNRVVLITGANKGIGFGMAEKIGSMGAKILMVCRDKSRGEEALKKLSQKNINALLYIADMESTESIEKLYEAVSKDVEKIDVLVNNAGVSLGEGPATIETTDINILRRTFDINFIGPFWMCKMFTQLVKKSDSGRIINFSSGLGQLTVPRMGGMPAYSSSKTAINAITKILADELKDTNIKVMSTDPGWIKTDLGSDAAPLSIEEGIETPVWLATADASELVTGEMYKERKILGW
jgi:NAD(P)-dependent dehydrogenase (short-subunit alcohol dehydrogenase family)